MKNNLSASYQSVVHQILRERRTSHHFKDQDISESLIENAVESLRWAPNHYLTEPWRVYLLGPEVKNQIISLNTDIVREIKGEKVAKIKAARWKKIPGWLLVNCIKSEDDLRQMEDYAACCCGIQNLMLSFWAGGVGVKWTTGEVIRHPRLARIVGFNAQDESVVGLLWFGVTREVVEQKRKPINHYFFRVP
tara:strand:- start:932 stop:1507 length:576 start_codon:yes stop_codon:yes gene_type:complete